MKTTIIEHFCCIFIKNYICVVLVFFCGSTLPKRNAYFASNPKTMDSTMIENYKNVLFAIRSSHPGVRTQVFTNR